jgi:transaldolase
MIKVPATAEGLPAVTVLIAEGVNVNATLMFSQRDYTDVSEAYLAGLEKRDAAGLDLSGVTSVASFFVSRIDTAVDKLLPAHSSLRGRIAVANARRAYALFRDVVASERFTALQKKGARMQRLLWGSTGTKNPDYSDVLYVEELIGPDTVNTVPQTTLDAFRDHGRPRLSLLENPFEAEELLEELQREGIDLAVVAAKVKDEGVAAFQKSYDSLLRTLEEKCTKVLVDKR